MMVHSLDFFKCINVGDEYLKIYRLIPDFSIDCNEFSFHK